MPAQETPIRAGDVERVDVTIRFEGDAAAFFERIEAMQSQPAGL